MRHSATFSKRKSPGVYLIYKNSLLVYVGYSGSDVYKAMYRHFQKWTDVTQVRVTYNPEQVKARVIYCNTAQQAAGLEKALIIKRKPKDNPNKYTQYTTDQQEETIYKKFLSLEETTKGIQFYDGGENPF